MERFPSQLWIPKKIHPQSCWRIPCITNHQAFEVRKWKKTTHTHNFPTKQINILKTWSTSRVGLARARHLVAWNWYQWLVRTLLGRFCIRHVVIKKNTFKNKPTNFRLKNLTQRANGNKAGTKARWKRHQIPLDLPSVSFPLVEISHGLSFLGDLRKGWGGSLRGFVGSLQIRMKQGEIYEIPRGYMMTIEKLEYSTSRIYYCRFLDWTKLLHDR